VKTRIQQFLFVMAALAGLLVIGMVLPGCSERENPVEPDLVADADSLFRQPYHFNNLEGNALKDEVSRFIYVYAPPGYAPIGQGGPSPVLYLLHDFGYDQNQFEIYNLGEMANNMMGQGELAPMIIVIVDASNLFGLGMYANSHVAGNYEDMIVPELLFAIEEASGAYNTHTRVAGKAARAIGGIGFGGQAALKLAIKHPDLFSSVSALNAPLAYAGDGGVTTEGIRGMFKSFFIENMVPAGDYDAYTAVVPRRDRPITRMLFAMAAAYSPTIDVEFLRPWSVRFNVPGFTDIVYFDFPFDQNLYIEEPVWERWMEHDVRRLYAENPGALDDVDVYIEASEEDEYGFQLQTALFVDDLQARGTVDYEYHTYSGTKTLPAGHDRLINTRLAEMLKFHAARLAQPSGQ